MKYLDLFSGCGGLSLGLRAAGLSQAAAVEKSPMAAETYFRNLISPSGETFQAHLQKDPLGQIDAGLLVDEAAELLRIIQTSVPNSIGGVDLLVGGPPCQGFSLAGKRDPNDKRNQLPWLFLDVVSKLSPKFVVIENVAGMKVAAKQQTSSPFEDLAEALSTSGQGYVVQRLLLNSAHFGAPQQRQRLFLVGVRKDIAEKNNLTATTATWTSKFADAETELIPALAPIPTVKEEDVRTVRDAIFDLGEIGKSGAPYSRELSGKFARVLAYPSDVVQNHISREHTDNSRRRFALIQLLSERGIRFENSDPELINMLSFPIKDKTGNSYETPTALLDAIRQLQTKKHSQKLLKWEVPSPTILTIPDDYIHPAEPRVLTVREMARLQGFPDEFTFHSKATTGGALRKDEVPQYSQVGNAVSPWVALALGKMLLRVNSEVR